MLASTFSAGHAGMKALFMRILLLPLLMGILWSLYYNTLSVIYYRFEINMIVIYMQNYCKHRAIHTASTQRTDWFWIFWGSRTAPECCQPSFCVSLLKLKCIIIILLLHCSSSLVAQMLCPGSSWGTVFRSNATACIQFHVDIVQFDFGGNGNECSISVSSFF